MHPAMSDGEIVRHPDAYSCQYCPATHFLPPCGEQVKQNEPAYRSSHTKGGDQVRVLVSRVYKACSTYLISGIQQATSTNNNSGMAQISHDTFLSFFSPPAGRVVNQTASKASATPANFRTVAFSWYRYNENRKGITIDNLYATVAAATPIFLHGVSSQVKTAK